MMTPRLAGNCHLYRYKEKERKKDTKRKKINWKIQLCFTGAEAGVWE